MEPKARQPTEVTNQTPPTRPKTQRVRNTPRSKHGAGEREPGAEQTPNQRERNEKRDKGGRRGNQGRGEGVLEKTG